MGQFACQSLQTGSINLQAGCKAGCEAQVRLAPVWDGSPRSSEELLWEHSCVCSQSAEPCSHAEFLTARDASLSL